MWPAVPRVSGAAASRDGGVGSGEPGTGDPSDERRQHGAGQLVQLGVAHGAQVEEQAAVVQAAHDGGRAETQRGGEPVGVPIHAHGHSDARHLGDGQDAGAGARDSVEQRDAVGGQRRRRIRTREQVAQALRASAYLGERRCQRRERRHARDRARRVQIEPEHGVERGQVELVDAQSARQRVAAHRRDGRGPAHGYSGLRAAEELVAAEGHDVGAGGDAARERRLLGEQRQPGQGAAAEVVDEHGVVLVGHAGELLERGLRSEPHDAVVAGVHAQDGARALWPGLLEVLEVGAVGGADFDQLGPALTQDVGDAKAVADLHELAAGDEHLAATARGGEVLVARGQLVEIGDGFRIPDILRESGAELVEVGTTNRTYLKDFEKAWTERTRAVLRVHTSNYRIVGFTAEPALEELAGLAHEHDAVLVDDLGSGALAGLPLFAEEPALTDSIAAGADVVTFSGDKLLGGPQAGVAVGRAATIEAMRRHPLARALRIDKLDLAALDAVLRLYLDPARAVERVPTLAALAAPLAEVRARAERLRDLLTGPGAAAALPADRVALLDTVARAGAGALPVTEVPSVAVAVSVDADADGLAAALRLGEPAVVCRLHDGRLLFDLRAVRDAELDELAGAVLAALA